MSSQWPTYRCLETRCAMTEAAGKGAGVRLSSSLALPVATTGHSMSCNGQYARAVISQDQEGDVCVRVCDWMVERDAGAAKAVQRVASTLCARPRRQGASSAMWAAVTRAVVWSPPFAPRSTCDSTTWIQDLTPLRKVRGSHLGSAVALRDRRLCDADLQLVCAAIVA
jgi:hypothetical protein